MHHWWWHHCQQAEPRRQRHDKTFHRVRAPKRTRLITRIIKTSTTTLRTLSFTCACNDNNKNNNNKTTTTTTTTLRTFTRVRIPGHLPAWQRHSLNKINSEYILLYKPFYLLKNIYFQVAKCNLQSLLTATLRWSRVVNELVHNQEHLAATIAVALKM